MQYSSTIICNLALGEVPAKPITSLTDGSLEARECNRVYGACVAELLQSFPWSNAVARQTLAEATNDRPNEWLHKYALPSNCAYPGPLIPTPNTSWPFYSPLPWQTLAGLAVGNAGLVGGFRDRAPPVPYERAGAFIYTDLDQAILQYWLNDVDEGSFTPLMAKALVYDIASRVCVLLSRADRKPQFQANAELYLARAQAWELNTNPQARQYDPIPDAFAVR